MSNSTTKTLSQPWLFIGTPAHDCRVHSKYTSSLLTLFDAALSLPPEQRFKISTSTVSGGGVAKARNNIAWQFLEKSQATHLIFVDSDMGPEPADIFRLVSHNRPIVGALYTHKKPGEIQWSCKAIDGEELDPKTGLQKVAAIGTGSLCIKREVFLNMRMNYPEIEYVEDWLDGRGTKRWDFFSQGVVTNKELGYPQPTYLTEDWYFSLRARELGYDVLADTGTLVKHWEGTTAYPLAGTVPMVDAKP